MKEAVSKIYQGWKRAGVWIAEHPLAMLTTSAVIIIFLIWVGLRY